MDVDSYSIDFISEDIGKLKLKYMVENQKTVFQLLVYDDDDDNYVPEFDFPYEVCDCSKCDMRTKKFWDDVVSEDKTTVFKNTSSLFEQFKGYELLGHKYDSGSGGFAQMFYFIYRDFFWTKTNAKLIFILSEAEAYSMADNVDFGFGILLCPIYIRKDANKADGENSFSKSYKKQNKV